MQQIAKFLKTPVLLVLALVVLTFDVAPMTTTAKGLVSQEHTSSPLRSLQIPFGSDKLTASDGAASDAFGTSVAISGDTVIVSARNDDDNGDNSGSAYIFVRNESTWNEQAKLTASDGAADDYFGRAVGISGDTVAIGAYLDDDNGDSSGSAYIFVRSGTTWSEQAKLTASDGAADDHFADTIGISGDTAIVGAGGNGDGSAYIFVRNGTTWSEQAKLIASDIAALDAFGTSVAISGDTAIVGAHNDDDKGDSSGSAYIFVRNGTTWSEQAKLTASDGAILDHFGYSVAISGDTVIVGALDDDDNGDSSGSAYIFVRDGTTWSQQAKLVANDGAAGQEFGRPVSISGNTAIVGAHLDDDNGGSSGSAYIFKRDGTTWSEQTKLTASDGAAGDHFGWDVGISGDTAIVGAYGDEDNGVLSGSAYVFAPRLTYLPIVFKDHPSPLPDVRITYIEHDPPGSDIEGEYVTIQNFDGSPVMMTDWTLRDMVPHIFTFPSFTLAPGATVRVWTKTGTNTATDLYWGSGIAIWDNEGDCAYLRSSGGPSVSYYCYYQLLERP